MEIPLIMARSAVRINSSSSTAFSFFARSSAVPRRIVLAVVFIVVSPAPCAFRAFRGPLTYFGFSLYDTKLPVLGPPQAHESTWFCQINGLSHRFLSLRRDRSFCIRHKMTVVSRIQLNCRLIETAYSVESIFWAGVSPAIHLRRHSYQMPSTLTNYLDSDIALHQSGLRYCPQVPAGRIVSSSPGYSDPAARSEKAVTCL